MSYSWETTSAASCASAAPATTFDGVVPRTRARAEALVARMPRPELAAVMSLAAVLNLWALAHNGWANQYYAAAVKSMGSSWHDFLFASLDRGGVMTVDKPPLALWVQALSVRAFGFHSLSILVPQALMGVASVALVYDLVRRRFGRVGGFLAGLALALTPITVAVSRHNNPDALLVLCCVAALWCAVRALENPRTRWLVAAGVCVGLGFETKMLVALVVVPGVAAAWLWLAPAGRGRWHALRQLLAGGGAMLLVGGAWPLLVELTPAADRPWVSGTSDNRVLSLIFEYNGLGRVDGQTGGPGGVAGNVFGGATGPLRLVNAALGGQAGWLLGFALVSGLAILLATRLRRADARTGWLMVVGGAFAITAVLFSFASGIFHPYYVSLLAPLAAALFGAGAAQLVSGGVSARVVGPLAVLAGVAVELAVRAHYPGQLTWLPPVLVAAGLLAGLALLASGSRAVRMAATGAAVAALLAAPAVWAFDTLGHPTNGTFPEGGPVAAESGGIPHGGAQAGGPGGGAGGFGSGSGGPGRGPRAPGVPGGPGGFAAPSGGGAPSAGGARIGAGEAGAAPQLFGRSETGGGTTAGASRAGTAPNLAGAGRGVGGAAAVGARGGIGAPMGAGVSSSVLSYVKRHGGGTIAVSSQSNAASAILDGDANVAGIGGFSGRESDVSVSWLAQEVRSGNIRWVLEEEGASGSAGAGGFPAAGGLSRAGGFGGRGMPGDTRVGAKQAMAAVAKACMAATLPFESSAAEASGTSETAGGGPGSAAKLYDCEGRAAALERTGTQQSRS